jgi:hypothetical protein
MPAISSIPEISCRSAGVTMIRTLIEVASDLKQDKLFLGLYDDTWHKLKEIKFFPVSSPQQRKCVLVNSTVISTPKNHSLCFSVLRTLPKDVLEILGKKKRGKSDQPKSVGYMEKFDNDRIQDLILEEYNDTLKNLFRRLSVNTSLDIEVLLGHVIKCGQLTETWVKKYNELTPHKKLAANFQKRASLLYESRITQSRKSYHKSNASNDKARRKPSVALKSIATEVQKEIHMIRMWSDYKNITYDEEDEFDEDEFDEGDSEWNGTTSNTQEFEFDNIKTESELNDVRFKMLKAQNELGQMLLNMKSSNANRAAEIEQRLAKELSNLNVVWIRRQRDADCARKASSMFYTFDFKSKWSDK